MKPRVVVVTNLFRDQLDRYGELDYTASVIRKSLQTLDENTTLVLNANDPLVATLGDGSRARVVFYSLEDERLKLPKLEDAADSITCLHCGHPYSYEAVYFGHIGKYRCPACELEQPDAHVRGTNIQLREKDSEVTVETPTGALRLKVNLPGLHNVSNALAVVAAAQAVGLSSEIIEKGFSQFVPAFGRGESHQLEGRELFLQLVKNPVSFNQILRTILIEPGKKNLLILINDNDPDGRDVSWLWDTDFELLRDRANFIIVSGQRAADMRLRLKYAEIEDELCSVEPGTEDALRQAIAACQPGSRLYILPTYTAMLDVRKTLTRLGVAKPYWEEE